MIWSLGQRWFLSSKFEYFKDHFIGFKPRFGRLFMIGLSGLVGTGLRIPLRKRTSDPSQSD